MRLALVYVPGQLREQTFRAVRAQAHGAPFLVPSPPGDLNYPDLLRQLYREPGDTILVEQDVVPPQGSIGALARCPELWCGHRLPQLGRLQPATFGLVRFSAELKRLHPQLMDRALARNPWDKPRRCLRPGEFDPFLELPPEAWPSNVAWPTCDLAFVYSAERRGLVWHEHQPPVEHLHHDPHPVYAELGVEEPGVGLPDGELVHQAVRRPQ